MLGAVNADLHVKRRSSGILASGRGRVEKRGRRVLAAMVAIVCAAGTVIAASSNASTLADADDNVEKDSILTPVRSVSLSCGPAPQWPFRGMIAYEGPDGSYRASIDNRIGAINGDFGLGFYNMNDGRVSCVRISEGASLCGGGTIYVDKAGVRWHYGTAGVNQEWNIFVPWGDHAFPLFVDSQGPDGWPRDRYRWHSRFGSRAAFGSGVADLELSIAGREWLGLATTRESKYYQIKSQQVNQANVTDYGLRLPETVADDFFERERYSPEDHFLASFAGTDGEWYGITILPYEPPCAGMLTYIIDSSTGRLITCGWARVGPLLVAPAMSVANTSAVKLPGPDVGINHSERCAKLLHVQNLQIYLEVSDS